MNKIDEKVKKLLEYDLKPTCEADGKSQKKCVC